MNRIQPISVIVKDSSCFIDLFLFSAKSFFRRSVGTGAEWTSWADNLDDASYDGRRDADALGAGLGQLTDGVLNDNRTAADGTFFGNPIFFPFFFKFSFFFFFETRKKNYFALSFDWWPNPISVSLMTSSFMSIEI